MEKSHDNNGFSLTEVLLAVVILAVGMIFIAGVFPVGIHFTTIAAERTTAAVVADEAFAKIRLYGIDPNELSGGELKNFNDVSTTVNIDPDEFAYPSTSGISQKRYFWSALCRRVGPNSRLVQVTVFVCRRTSPNLRYHDPDGSGTVDWPKPVKIEVSQAGVKDDELEIDYSDPAEKTFINDGYTIIDDKTGRLYRVLERYPDDDDTILLGRDWDDSPPGGSPDKVWVIPPPLAPGTSAAQKRCSGRYPCIAIYQKVIRF